MSILVFIHRSIKTRIETRMGRLMADSNNKFLYIDPLKQGLKHIYGQGVIPERTVFIHRSIKTRIETKTIGYKIA